MKGPKIAGFGGEIGKLKYLKIQKFRTVSLNL
jgi:hypothetical protein